MIRLAPSTKCRRFVVQRARTLLCAAALALTLPGCDSSSQGRSDTTRGEEAPTHRVRLAQYRFAPGLAEAHPEVAAFLRGFLETCLARDYEGYRRMLSTSATPDSRERFEALFNALEAITIDAIEPRADASLEDGRAFVVRWTVDIDPTTPLGQRRARRHVAALVHRELGIWRIRPAPGEKRSADGAAPASAPVASAPSYPWEDE